MNTETTASQSAPTVARTPDGAFIVVWQSGGDQDGSGSGIFAQRFDAAGVAFGAESQLNTFTAGDQTRPVIATEASGAFLAVWQSAAQDGNGLGIYGRLLFADSLTLGPEIRINTTILDDQHQPTIGAGGGTFVVAWESKWPSYPYQRVILRRFNGAGTPLTNEVEAAPTFFEQDQIQPAVAVDAGGIATVVRSEVFLEGPSPFVSRHGAALEELFRGGVNGIGTFVAHGVASDPAGGFVVATASSYFPPKYGFPLLASRKNAAAQHLESQSLTRTMDVSGGRPAVAHLHPDRAGFVVVWDQQRDDDPANPADLMAFVVRPTVFADGFESGDTSAWTTEVP